MPSRQSPTWNYINRSAYCVLCMKKLSLLFSAILYQCGVMSFGHRFLSKLHSHRIQDFDDNKYFSYVDESISNTLLSIIPGEISNNQQKEVEMIDSNGIIIWNSISGKAMEQDLSLSLVILIELANQSETIIFRKDEEISLPGPIKSLIDMTILENDESIDQSAASPSVLVPALLALNMVESSIRNFCGKKHGKAPLLKDMIEILSSSKIENSEMMAKLLRSMLLPKIGLSLRNLLWHGFIPALPRKWLSLSIVIILTLDHMTKASSLVSSDVDSQEYLKTLQQMRDQLPLKNVIDHGNSILASKDLLMKLESDLLEFIVPPSYKRWLQLCMEFVTHPVIFSSSVTPLIEHLLRLYWCEANDMYIESIAQQNEYYCTLDGAGQRNKHNIILMSSFTNQRGEDLRSKLVDVIGHQSLALITDLFASPRGPNIRSKASHGALNHHLYEELSHVARLLRCGQEIQISSSEISDNLLRDQTAALISTLDVILSFGPISQIKTNHNQNVPSFLEGYQSQYSYSGSLRRVMNEAMETFVLLHDFTCAKNITQNYINANHESIGEQIRTMAPTKDYVFSKFKYVYGYLVADSKIFEESIEKAASSCGASTLLLSEVSTAAKEQIALLDSVFSELKCVEIPITTRRKKQVQRILSTAHLTLDFYSLVIFCALLYVERQLLEIECIHTDMYDEITNDVLENSVRRSRMAVSTFVTSENVDRALKAVSLYSEASCVKQVSNAIFLN